MFLTDNISFLLCSLFFWYAIITCYEKPMVIVVPSYNNSQWYTRNLDSICAQRYTNYRVIYIDDYSSDYTADLVQQYVTEKKLKSRFNVQKNTQHMGALYNHYRAVMTCMNDEIIVQLDGDDWFAHEDVLNVINQAYQDENIWLTYGQYTTYPQSEKGVGTLIHPNVVKNNTFREYAWVTTALRTFYAGLFKQIKLEDLLYNGLFFQTSCDLAFMFPMIEMCGGHFKFIADVVYIYNQTLSNDFKINRESQLLFDKLIRAKKRYSPLTMPPYVSDITEEFADLIIFSQNPEKLLLSLSRIMRYVSGIHNIYIFYQVDNSTQKKYAVLKDIWREITFHQVTHSFKDTLLKVLDESTEHYILIADDAVLVEEFVDVKKTIFWLKQTQAYCFCLALGKNVIEDQRQPPLFQIIDDVYFWQLCRAEEQWLFVHNYLMTVFNKNRVKDIFNSLEFRNAQELLHDWQALPIDADKVALCYEEKKVKNTECNNSI